MTGVSGSCAACGASGLRPYLRVAQTGAPAGADLIPTTDAFGSALADIVACPRCGHGQLERMPTDAELGEAYGEAESVDYVDEEEGQRATARVALDRIERHTSGPGALLDLGCWVGFLLAEANERGWRTLGVEPSAFASRHAREELGLDVITGDLLTTHIPPGEWDAVVLGDVIEHLPNPGEALDRIAKLLKPGGVVYMAIPDAGSRLARAMGARWWSVIPTHVHYFNRRSIGEIVARRGYRLEYLGTAPKAFSVRYYLGRLGGYSPPLARAAVGAAAAAGVADRLWSPDFRDRMAVVARWPSG